MSLTYEFRHRPRKPLHEAAGRRAFACLRLPESFPCSVLVRVGQRPGVPGGPGLAEPRSRIRVRFPSGQPSEIIGDSQPQRQHVRIIVMSTSVIVYSRRFK